MQLYALAWVLALTSATALRAPKNNVTLDVTAANATQSAIPHVESVETLRKQLTNVASHLRSMLGDSSELAHAKIAPALNLFLEKVDSVLKETASTKDPAGALTKLQAVKASIGSLTTEITARQETLMMEDQQQSNNLLLGVLMSRQKEPFAQQLAILDDEQFRDLPVSKALMAKHSEDTPLFSQAAQYLDSHSAKEAVHTNISSSAATVATRSQAVAAKLQARVDALEREYQEREEHHNKKMQSLRNMIQADKKTKLQAAKAVLKREEREFKKWAAMRTHDIQSMKAAVDAVKKGDVKALKKAQDALMNSLKAMQAQTGGFLYLIQLGHTLFQKDCPYCVAQCLDKCHTDGRNYVECLGECSEAGKGK